jgi:hypothetical protein
MGALHSKASFPTKDHAYSVRLTDELDRLVKEIQEKQQVTGNQAFEMAIKIAHPILVASSPLG